MTGVSNGGYLTRWQLENEPGVFDGGVESEGTLFERGNTLLGSLPEALRAYPVFRDSTGAAKEAARQRDVRRRLRAGLRAAVGPALPRLLGPDAAHLPRGARPDLRRRARGRHHADLPARRARLRDADTPYDVSTRPGVADALRGLTLTGKLKRPMLSLHGDLDTLLPIDLHGTSATPSSSPSRSARACTGSTSSSAGSTSTAS